MAIRRRTTIFLICLICFLAALNIEGFDAQAAETAYTAVVDASGSVPLKLRKEPYGTAAIKKEIPRGATIKVFGKKKNGWIKAEYKNTRGYVYASYVTITGKKNVKNTGKTKKTSVSYKKVKVNDNGSVSLKMRSGPSTAYKIVKRIPRGSTIKVSGTARNGWIKAVYKGKKGYVCTDYLVMNKSTKKTQSGQNAETGEYTRIVLNVPKFFQWDSRWKGKALGKSNVTFGKGGCATTCLAMTESYFRKETVTPLALSKDSSFIKYTTDGYLHWPAAYKEYYASGYPLEYLYQELQKGHPVLCGGIKKNGKQHWVVVTGYTGKHSDKLRKSDFIVNDPADRDSNLKEFSEYVSRFYKVVYRKSNK